MAGTRCGKSAEKGDRFIKKEAVGKNQLGPDHVFRDERRSNEVTLFFIVIGEGDREESYSPYISVMILRTWEASSSDS